MPGIQFRSKKESNEHKFIKCGKKSKKQQIPELFELRTRVNKSTTVAVTEFWFLIGFGSSFHVLKVPRVAPGFQF